MKPENMNIPITDVKIRLVENGTDGLLAWASCVVAGALKLDNISIRRSKSDDGLYLSYPAKRTPGGDRYPYFNPISAEAARAVENALLARLGALAKSAAEGGVQG